MEMLPLQVGDVQDTDADVSKLIAAVDYVPGVSMEESVGKFMRWYQGCYDA